MGERTEKVEKILEKHEKKQKQIETLHGTKNITEQIAEVNRKISEADLKIERLQDKLSDLSSLDEDKALREEYQKQIEGLENGFFDESKSKLKIENLQAKLSDAIRLENNAMKISIQGEIEKLKSGEKNVWVEGKKQYLEEKQKLEAELKERDPNRVKIELSEVDDRLRASLTQERIAIDKDLTRVDLEMQKAEIEAKITYQKIKDFDYKYEEYDVIEEGNRVTKKILVNQKELDRLNVQYESLQNNIETKKETLKDLQEAKAMCEKELAVFKQRDEKKAKEFSKAWNNAREDKEEPKEVEEVKKDEEGKEQQGQSKEDEGNKEQNSKPIKWHPGLTEEQKDELKAEGIMPGDPEYDAYLKNHGLGAIKPENKEQSGTQGEKQPENRLLSDLNKEQIDELKAEGLEPGDPEYDMYLKNQGIAVPQKCNIQIGRKGFISYQGQEYKISKKAIKYGVNIDSLNDKELEKYLKEDIGIKGEKGIETMKQLIEKGLIDMTIVHAIHSTRMPEEQKRELIQRYEHKALYAQAGKEYPYMDVAYDMDDLSKASLFTRIAHREVNSDEKEKILKNATRAGKYKMGRIIGKYKPNLREKYLNWRAGKQPLAFPVKDMETQPKNVQEQQKEFKEKIAKSGKEVVEANKEPRKRNFKNLSLDNKAGFDDLATKATWKSQSEKETPEQGMEQNDDGSR